MKKIIILIIFFLFLPKLVLADHEGEQLSGAMRTQNYDYKILKTFVIKHRDGSPLTINLIKFNTPACITSTSTVMINGTSTIQKISGCVDAFTVQTSDNTRKYDNEHPVDTTETINIKVYGTGPFRISETSILHELIHAMDFHWHSRSVCEANWRYSECMESQAYDYTDLVSQVRKLKIKLI